MNAQSALAAQRRNKSVKRLMNALLLSAAFVAAYGGFAAMSCEAKGSPDACIGGGGDCLDIQGMIDGASANGGGKVVVPAGRHLVGQIDLRSNVELHLEKGAVLEGKTGLENYRVTTLPYSEGTWSAVVSAIGVTNVAVTGEGEIFGNGTAWPQPEDYGGNQEGLRPRGVFLITGEGEIFGNGTAWPQPEDYGGNQEGLRPRGVFFADCRAKGVALRNVRIVCRGGGDTAAERTRPVPEVAGKYPDAHMFGCILPAYGLYARHVDGLLSLEDVSFVLKPGTTDGRDDKVLDDVMSIQAF